MLFSLFSVVRNPCEGAVAVTDDQQPPAVTDDQPAAAFDNADIICDRTCINRPLGAKHNFSVWAKIARKPSFSEFHFIVYIILASSKDAFSDVTASLPSFVRSERKVMAAVTGGDIRNAIAETKRRRHC